MQLYQHFARLLNEAPVWYMMDSLDSHLMNERMVFHTLRLFPPLFLLGLRANRLLHKIQMNSPVALICIFTSELYKTLEYFGLISKLNGAGGINDICQFLIR